MQVQVQVLLCVLLCVLFSDALPVRRMWPRRDRQGDGRQTIRTTQFLELASMLEFNKPETSGKIKELFADTKMPLVTHNLDVRKMAPLCGMDYEVVYSKEDGDTVFKMADTTKTVCDLPDGLYTWIIRGDNMLVYGKYENSLEWGTRHIQIDEGKRAYAAGEMQVASSNIKFNTLSGSFVLYGKNLLGQGKITYDGGFTKWEKDMTAKMTEVLKFDAEQGGCSKVVAAVTDTLLVGDAMDSAALIQACKKAWGKWDRIMFRKDSFRPFPVCHAVCNGKMACDDGWSSDKKISDNCVAKPLPTVFVPWTYGSLNSENVFQRNQATCTERKATAPTTEVHDDENNCAKKDNPDAYCAGKGTGTPKCCKGGSAKYGKCVKLAEIFQHSCNSPPPTATQTSVIKTYVKVPRHAPALGDGDVKTFHGVKTYEDPQRPWTMIPAQGMTHDPVCGDLKTRYKEYKKLGGGMYGMVGKTKRVSDSLEVALKIQYLPVCTECYDGTPNCADGVKEVILGVALSAKLDECPHFMTIKGFFRCGPPNAYFGDWGLVFSGDIDDFKFKNTMTVKAYTKDKRKADKSQLSSNAEGDFQYMETNVMKGELGDLWSAIKGKDDTTHQYMAAAYTYQFLYMMYYLQTRAQFSHGDVKPDNFFYDTLSTSFKWCYTVGEKERCVDFSKTDGHIVVLGDVGGAKARNLLSGAADSIVGDASQAEDAGTISRFKGDYRNFGLVFSAIEAHIKGALHGADFFTKLTVNLATDAVSLLDLLNHAYFDQLAHLDSPTKSFTTPAIRPIKK